jgi:MFS family permease
MFLLFAVLPLFVVQELKGAESQVGLIMGAFAVAALLSRPISGWLADTWSRKAGVSLGALIYCLAPILYTQAGSVPIMLMLRFFHGVGLAAYTTAASVLAADLSPPARRGEAMGYYGIALNLSMAVGPALGAALVGPMGFTGLFWFAAALALGSLFLGRLVHEPDRIQAHPQASAERPSLFSRTALPPALVAACMTTTFGTVVSFLPLFVEARHLGNPGIFFSVYSVMVIASRFWAGRWSDRFGRPAVIIPGMIILVASMAVLAYTTSMRGLLLAAVLQGLGFGGVQPAIMALTIDRSTPRDRGAALATLMGAFDVGMGLGAIGLGLLLEHTSFTVMYLCAGGVSLIGAVIFAGLTLRSAHRKERKKSGRDCQQNP